MAACLCAPDAAAFDLPQGTPGRQAGMWQVELSGRLEHQDGVFNIRKTSRICLDAKADGALHELNFRESEMFAAAAGEACEAPRFSLRGNVLSAASSCRGSAGGGQPAGSRAIRWTTTFVDARHVQTQFSSQNQGPLFDSALRFTESMRYLGGCEAGYRAGDMLKMSWKVDGDETLKSRSRENVHRLLEDYRLSTRSTLERIHKGGSAAP